MEVQTEDRTGWVSSELPALRWETETAREGGRGMEGGREGEKDRKRRGRNRF